MDSLFLEAKKNLALNMKKFFELEKQLPPIIYIAYSIQYKKLAEKMKNELEKRKRITIEGFSQILGCSKIKTNCEILLVGEARFHALNLAVSSGNQVTIFDNFSISKISKKEIELISRKEKGKYLKFLDSPKIGILASVKSGQENLKLSEKIKQDLKKEKKKVYLFLADNISVGELENFPLPIYINTSCPRLEEDSSKIINYRTIQKYTGTN